MKSAEKNQEEISPTSLLAVADKATLVVEVSLGQMTQLSDTTRVCASENLGFRNHCLVEVFSLKKNY